MILFNQTKYQIGDIIIDNSFGFHYMVEDVKVQIHPTGLMYDLNELESGKRISASTWIIDSAFYIHKVA